MSGATSLDLSQIRTDALSSASTFRALIGVYSSAQVDALISAIDGLTAEDIDTLAEINAILTDADVASVSYVDGLAANYATAAQGALADSAVQPADLAAVATSGAYSDLSGTPTLGTAASSDTGDFATAAQGALADTALQPSDITSGTITPGTGDIDFDNLGGGGAESPLVLTATTATETPLTAKGAASQTAPLQVWENSAGTDLLYVGADGWLYPYSIGSNQTGIFWVQTVAGPFGTKMYQNNNVWRLDAVSSGVARNAITVNRDTGVCTFTSGFDTNASVTFNAGTVFYINSPGVVGGTITFASKSITLGDSSHFSFNTTNGSKIGTSTSQKFAFWNATPVAQQVLATGAGATVDDVIALLQTLGLCRQS